MCPQCRQPLIVVELHGVEVDHCLECRGIWLDAGELELITELAGAAPGALAAALRGSPAGQVSGRRCPRCRKKMRRASIGTPTTVELERCPRGHGLWLDAGELATIVREMTGPSDAAVAEFLGDLLWDRLQTGRTTNTQAEEG